LTWSANDAVAERIAIAIENQILRFTFMTVSLSYLSFAEVPQSIKPLRGHSERAEGKANRQFQAVPHAQTPLMAIRAFGQ
jgi:hypothetical protein